MLRTEWQRHARYNFMEISDWSDLRQKSSNENVAPAIPDSDTTDVALQLRNMVNVIFIISKLVLVILHWFGVRARRCD